MLETLLKILAADVPAPEIILEEDGDLGLDWSGGDFSLSIAPSGKVNWAVTGGRHGTDLDEFLEIVRGFYASDF